MLPATTSQPWQISPNYPEKIMKLLAALVLVLTSLTGCGACPVPYGNGQPDGYCGG